MALIAGNWKMFRGPAATRDFFDQLDLTDVPDRNELVIFPPSISLQAAVAARPARVRVGVQNIHWEDEGAFTGEVSAAMARQVGADLALIGHSERRHLFGETDEQVAWKTGAAIRHGLVPVVCVGETLAERRAGLVEEVILRQLDAALPELAAAVRALVAYEPVWAIGTGENATPEDASSAHATLRRRLGEGLGAQAQGRFSILYGGSVKPGNAAELLAADHVDGVLVGGASVDPAAFVEIARAAP
ncbi:MAG: triose-phosphate isomerase [Longimicrobiales bacterium]